MGRSLLGDTNKILNRIEHTPLGIRSQFKPKLERGFKAKQNTPIPKHKEKSSFILNTAPKNNGNLENRLTVEIRELSMILV